MKWFSKQCIELVKRFEGYSSKAYLCPAGEWTIGYGHTFSVKEGDVIDKASAETLLKEDLADFCEAVLKYDTQYNWTQNELDALTSFAYNIGSIWDLTGHGTRTKQEIADKMLLYVHGGGEVLPGLVERRQVERELFLKGKQEDIDMPMIQYGDKGKAVVILQVILGGLECDGIFGGNTKNAVVSFQHSEGLQVDGIVGPDTWKALINTL